MLILMDFMPSIIQTRKINIYADTDGFYAKYDPDKKDD